MMKTRDYRFSGAVCPETIKHVVIGVERLCFQTEIQREYGGEVGLEKMAKREAKRGLLEGVEKYIQTEVIEDCPRKGVRATIYLPYVYADVMRRLEQHIASEQRANASLIERLEKSRDEVKYLRLPWYKKLWKKLTTTKQQS